MNTLARYIRPEHKAAARSLGFALTLGDFESWQAFSAVIEARLSEPECAAVAFSVLRSQPPEQAIMTADASINGVGEPRTKAFMDTPAGRAALIAWREDRDRKLGRAA